MCVWARKTEGGDWYPAIVIGLGRELVRVKFENDRRSAQPYSNVALRNPGKNGADKPAR
jgi:hypothetical protein